MIVLRVVPNIRPDLYLENAQSYDVRSFPHKSSHCSETNSSVLTDPFSKIYFISYFWSSLLCHTSSLAGETNSSCRLERGSCQWHHPIRDAEISQELSEV